MRKMAENEHQNTIKHILYVLITYKLDFFYLLLLDKTNL